MRALPKALFLCLLVSALRTASVSAQAAQASRTTTYKPEKLNADFDFLWRNVHDNYAYLDAKTTDWDKVRDVYRPQLAEVQTRAQFISFLEHVLEELYDPHASLNTNLLSSPRLVPTGADVWAEWRGDKVIVSEVRPGSAAEKAGLRAGMEVLSIGGVATRLAVQQRVGHCLRRPDPAADDWALRSLLAGRHDGTRRFVVRDGSKPHVLMTPDDARSESRSDPEGAALLHADVLHSDPRVGYIRINNSLGQTELIGQFDAALDRLKNTRGLILDLRDTPSGGNSTVARGILGRFIARDMFYQEHDSPAEVRAHGVQQKWVDIVSPRGPFRYSAPVVVLVDHWTASMGEGIAIGLDGMKRAAVVGTRMAGLNGAVEGIALPSTGIGVNFPTQRLFHVNGTPRENFVPPVTVDLSHQAALGRDVILEAGLKTLSEKMR